MNPRAARTETASPSRRPVFALEETAVVIGKGSDEEILAAAEACPALAITVTDAETGEVVFP